MNLKQLTLFAIDAGIEMRWKPLSKGKFDKFIMSNCGLCSIYTDSNEGYCVEPHKAIECPLSKMGNHCNSKGSTWQKLSGSLRYDCACSSKHTPCDESDNDRQVALEMIDQLKLARKLVEETYED